MILRAAFLFLLLCLGGLAVWVLHSLAEEDSGFLPWRDPAVTAGGRVLYAAHCAGCHGMPDGSAAPAANASDKATPLHDESGHTWQHPDFVVFRLVRDGVTVTKRVPVDPELMPRFEGTVSDSELVAILSYIKSTWPENLRQSHDQVNRMYAPYNEAFRDLIDAHAGEPG